MSWRFAALGLLSGGVAAGFLLSKAGRRPSLVLGGALVSAALPIAIASRHPPIPAAATPGASGADADRVSGSAGAVGMSSKASEPGRPTFSIVVAGRNEADVLPDLVADVARLDWRRRDGSPAFELLVVDDRSLDGTGEAVRDAAERAGIADVTTVIRREGTGLPDGKGAALTAAQPERCSGDVVVVLDADARISPQFLRSIARYIEAGMPALTARRRVEGAEVAGLAQAQADEQTLDGELQRGRWALGGCSEFRGNGIIVERALLASVGGWRAEALTEDLDLSSRLAAERGVRVGWAIDVEVWEQPVRSWPGLWRQRLRWAEGSLRRLMEYGPALLRSERLSTLAKLDFTIYAAQLAAPPVIVGALLGAIGGRPRAAVILLGSYVAATAGLAWDALRWEVRASMPLAPAERLSRSIRTALFSGLWLGVLPVATWRLATRRGPVRYDKMPHRREPA